MDKVDKIVFLQPYFRSKKIKVKVFIFSQLPPEIWNIILYYIRYSTFDIQLNRIIHCRISRLYWTFPRKFLHQKMRTLTLTKKCICILDVRTREHVIDFCLRLLQHQPSKAISLHINSILELYYGKKIYNKNIHEVIYWIHVSVNKSSKSNIVSNNRIFFQSSSISSNL